MLIIVLLLWIIRTALCVMKICKEPGFWIDKNIIIQLGWITFAALFIVNIIIPVTLFIYSFFYLNKFKKPHSIHQLYMIVIILVLSLLIWVMISYQNFIHITAINSLLLCSFVYISHFNNARRRIYHNSILIVLTILFHIVYLGLHVADSEPVYSFITLILIVEILLVLLLYVTLSSENIIKLSNIEVPKKSTDCAATGITFLNHTFKNDISKISICFDNLKNSIFQKDNLNPETSNIDEYISIMSDSIEQLRITVNRIQNKW